LTTPHHEVCDGTERGQHQGGTAVDFDQARADVEAAWRRALLGGIRELIERAEVEKAALHPDQAR
jgi:hypothetical protein